MDLFYPGNRAGGAVWLLAGVLFGCVNIVVLLVALGVGNVPGIPGDDLGRLPFVVLFVVGLYTCCYFARLGLAISAETRISGGEVVEQDLFGRVRVLELTSDANLDQRLLVARVGRWRGEHHVPRSYPGLYRIRGTDREVYVNLGRGWRDNERSEIDAEVRRLVTALGEMARGSNRSASLPAGPASE